MRLADAPAAVSTYTSEVFDAGQIARWGRVEVQTVKTAAPAFTVSVRTGNVPSSVEGWSDWVKVRTGISPEGGAGEAGVPAGRYAQWKLELRAGAEVSAVALNYLPRNVAPVVDDVVVAPGARVAAAPAGGAAADGTGGAADGGGGGAGDQPGAGYGRSSADGAEG